MLKPGDAAYAEIGKLDPAGAGTASCDIVPGVATRLSARVRRVAAPNASFMTGPGTNSYIIGDGDEVTIIDPGPAIESHIDALLEITGGRIRSILATHTHPDHSPAAAILKARTGAELLGRAPPRLELQDQSFEPDRVLADGERIEAGETRFRVIHTPGHASNHLCYLLEDERLLFTGDHVMQGSTVVINPPDGDMTAYLASLRLLQREEIDFFAPGHGFLVGEPREMVELLVRHRLFRESKVVNVVQELGAAYLEELVLRVYDDVPEDRHRVASRSLLAHLIKLRDEGRVAERDGRWSLS